LVEHNTVHHSVHSTYLCTECPRKFKERRDLLRHCVWKHNNGVLELDKGMQLKLTGTTSWLYDRFMSFTYVAVTQIMIGISICHLVREGGE